jgi:hypothetical protein
MKMVVILVADIPGTAKETSKQLWRFPMQRGRLPDYGVFAPLSSTVMR